MSLQEISDLIIEYRWQVAFVLFTTMIQISPLKINPWTKVGEFFKWVFKKLGHLLSPLILDDVKVLNAKLLDDVKEDNANTRLEIKNDIKEFKTETYEFEKRITLRVEELNKSVQGARQDSIDRYENSIVEYKSLRTELELEIENLGKLIKYEVTATKLELMRPTIIRFVAEVKAGIKFDKEAWDTMRDICVKYVTFCQDNKKFLNSLIDGALNFVLDNWAKEVWKYNEQN